MAKPPTEKQKNSFFRALSGSIAKDPPADPAKDNVTLPKTGQNDEPLPVVNREIWNKVDKPVGKRPRK